MKLYNITNVLWMGNVLMDQFGALFDSMLEVSAVFSTLFGLDH